MMHVLLESAPAPAPRRAGWTAASFAIHASTLAAAVILTMRVTDPPRVAEAIIAIEPYRPPAPQAPVPRAPTVSAPTDRPAIVLPDLPAVPLPLLRPTFNATEIPEARPGGSIIGAPIVSPALPVGAIATPDQVERVVFPRANNPRPNYPSALRNAVVEGDVLTRFVVDTTGRVERNSIEIIRASHSLFADAVREWLPRTRYEPATIAGRPVRQLVEQSVGFTLKR